MILNTIPGMVAEGGSDAAADAVVYTVKASATRNIVSWGSVAIAATASLASLY
jgi:hypothetical protein